MKEKKESNYQNRLGKNLNYKEGKRELTINITRGKDGCPKAKLNVPIQWIKELNIERKPKNVIAVCKDGKIEIMKNI